jgi:biopolymer transport protein ExbB/TolQ
VPAIAVLILGVAIVIFELGSIVMEVFGERLRARYDAVTLIRRMEGRGRSEILLALEESSLPKSQRLCFNKLLSEDLPQHIFEEMATQIITDEEARQRRVTSITDTIARIAPMFGLMATLIPLGPGLIALGQGDTQTLSGSLLTAFDATVAGLASAGVAYVISRIRKTWYDRDIAAMETITEAAFGELYGDSGEEGLAVGRAGGAAAASDAGEAAPGEEGGSFARDVTSAKMGGSNDEGGR